MYKWDSDTYSFLTSKNKKHSGLKIHWFRIAYVFAVLAMLLVSSGAGDKWGG
jgi:hypothetical protein